MQVFVNFLYVFLFRYVKESREDASDSERLGLYIAILHYLYVLLIFLNMSETDNCTTCFIA